MNQDEVVREFSKIYYDLASQTWKNTRWLGHEIQKCPTDLVVYQEILYETKPDLIIECGTYKGGSTLFLASICDLLGSGRIVSIDITDRPGRPKHPRIEYIQGSSIAPSVWWELQNRFTPTERILVILDSDHEKSHVLQEMRLYGPIVTMGSYMIVEDTNINGHPVFPSFGPGPMEAVEEFMKDCTEFEIDLSREKLLLTQNPNGFLKRVAAPAAPAKEETEQ